MQTEGWPIAPLAMRDVVVSPDGRHVYSVISGDFTSNEATGIAIFDRDAETGRISYEAHAVMDAWESASFVISPDGKHLYAAAFAGFVQIFERDLASGSLTTAGSTSDAAIGSFNDRIVVAPGGGHIYTVGIGSVHAYERSPASGLLTEVDAEIEPFDDPRNLSIEISPDGRNLYVGEWGGVVVYTVDMDTGEIDRVQTLGESDGLSELIAINIGVSPDGRNVYATGADDGVFVFARDTGSGELALVERVEGVGMKTDLGVLEVSPDGTRVYVTGADVPNLSRSADGISSFARDPSTGRLSYIETYVDYPYNGPFRPGGIAFGEEGRDVYVAAAVAGNVGAFRALVSCGQEPKAECREPTAPRRSRLRIKDSSKNRKDALVWTWTRGEATSSSAIGNPLTTTDYVFCVYDREAGAWALRSEAQIPAGGTCSEQPCWTATGGPETSRVYYQDDTGARGAGIRNLEIRAGEAGASSIRLKGKGEALKVPALPMAQSPHVAAQLVNREGECWGAEYSSPAPSNGERRFNDRSD